ncbi:MAG TPA: S8 family serine peptidase, partial [Solirubrobacteraceae bacterium]|nr:S8 family serine peptidase [Solirubrobacteraceae bacterium]
MRDLDTATFEPPPGLPDVVPGQIFIRLHPSAVADAAPAGSAATAALAETIAEPLSYLRESFGLRSVRALSGRAAVGEQRSHQPHAMALALADAAVAEPEAILAGVLVAELDPGAITTSVLRDIEASPAIEFAEPVAARWLCAGPDPARNRQWGLRAIRWFESRARHPHAGAVRVDIIDSGVDAAHRLIPRLALDDHGSFKQDDLLGHGTHVTGILAGGLDDEAGVAGVTSCAIGSRKVLPDVPHEGT